MKNILKLTSLSLIILFIGCTKKSEEPTPTEKSVLDILTKSLVSEPVYGRIVLTSQGSGNNQSRVYNAWGEVYEIAKNPSEFDPTKIVNAGQLTVGNIQLTSPLPDLVYDFISSDSTYKVNFGKSLNIRLQGNPTKGLGALNSSFYVPNVVNFKTDVDASKEMKKTGGQTIT
jgi:hypothetical protein